MKIYKYFNFSSVSSFATDNRIDSFKNNYLWFSKPRFFNDPFDCNLQVISYYNNFLNSLSLLSPNAKDLIIENTKEFGICCFSKSNDNIHMWSHYADSHKGICVEYDSSNFDDYFSSSLKCRCFLQEVDYRDTLINLNGDIEWERQKDFTETKQIGQIVNDPKLLDRLFEKLLLQKNNKTWSNENEIRLILGGLARKNNPDKEFEAGYKIPIERDIITGIIFGVNASVQLKEAIEQIFGSGIKYQNAKLDFENWKLKIE